MISELYSHRTDKGTWITIDPEGCIPHNPYGPAYVSFDGLLETYWINGLRHREDGPACIRHSPGTVDSVRYYIKGEECISPFVYKEKVRICLLERAKKEAIQNAKLSYPELMTLYELNI